MSTKPCQPAEKTLKTIHRRSIITFYFFFDFLVDMVDKGEKCPKYQAFPRQPAVNQSVNKLSTGGFSEWKFHLPGFFFRDFLKTVPPPAGLVDTLPALFENRISYTASGFCRATQPCMMPPAMPVFIISQIARVSPFPIWNLSSQRFLIKLLGAYPVTGVVLQIGVDHASLCVLLHEVLLVGVQVSVHFYAE